MKNSPYTKELYTIDEAATACDVNPIYIRNQIKKGKIEAIVENGQLMIPLESIQSRVLGSMPTCTVANIPAEIHRLNQQAQEQNDKIENLSFILQQFMGASQIGEAIKTNPLYMMLKNGPEGIGEIINAAIEKYQEGSWTEEDLSLWAAIFCRITEQDMGGAMEYFKASHPWNILLKLADAMIRYLDKIVFNEKTTKVALTELAILAKLEKGKRNIIRIGAYLNTYVLSPSQTKLKVLEMMVQLHRNSDELDAFIITHFINRKKMLILTYSTTLSDLAAKLTE